MIYTADNRAGVKIFKDGGALLVRLDNFVVNYGILGVFQNVTPDDICVVPKEEFEWLVELYTTSPE